VAKTVLTSAIIYAWNGDLRGGFVAAWGARATPDMAWVDGTPQGFNVVGLAEASDDRDVTYGTGREASTARANCASTPWTQAATAFPSFAAMCDDVDEQTIIVCRVVQNVLRKTFGAPATG
jgi:hypothetical protein